MELDKRIIEDKRPLTCLDVEQAREFVGKECIFSDIYANFKDINQYLFVDSDYAAILSIDERASCGDYVFKNSKNNLRYSLILPWEWVEQPITPEPEYKPYTLKEFLEAMESGLFESWIKMRHTKSKKECEFLYTGYQRTEVNDYICLGCNLYDFKTLLRDYEIPDLNGKWHPFGVLDEG